MMDKFSDSFSPVARLSAHAPTWAAPAPDDTYSAQLMLPVYLLNLELRLNWNKWEI